MALERIMNVTKFSRLNNAITGQFGVRTAMVILALVGVMTLLVALQVLSITNSMFAFQALLERSIDQRAQVRTLYSLLQQAELTRQNYVYSDAIDERRKDLEDVERLKLEIPRELNKMTELFAETSNGQLDLSRQLEKFTNFWIAELDNMMISTQTGTALPMLPEAPPELDTGQIRDLVNQMITFEEEEIRAASFIIQTATYRSRIVSIITLAGVAFLLVAVLMHGLIYLANRNRVELALLNANRLTEKANAAKTEFLATMSHEIRTPLTGVLGYTELLLSEKLSGRQREMAERIQTSCSNLSAIVNDILDFSKVEAGQISLEPEPFSLHMLIDNVISIESVVAKKKYLKISSYIAAEVPDRLIGDEPRIRQVLLNLLSNAVKFTHEGHVAMLVFHEGTTDAGELIRIEVEDTGIGFGKEKRELLFKRFSQLDTSIRRKFGGTGLGLAISKKMIDLMGGTIDVESIKGVGTKFWITLTLPRADAQEAPRVDKSELKSSTVGRILLVEDSEQNQELISTILLEAGHSVDIANDGAEAIEAVKRASYDLILMDIQMPRLDGPTATKRIRKMDNPASKIPIIALTANVLPQQVSIFRKAGMSDFIPKPFRRDELLAKISGWLDSESIELLAQTASISGDSTFDAQALEDIRSLMGDPWVRSSLKKLREDIHETFLRDQDPKSIDETILKQKAHLIVSHSAQLGFMKMSWSCSDLEEVCTEGINVRPAFRIAQQFAKLSIQKIDELLVNLKTS